MTRQVRELLVELDGLFQEFHGHTTRLCESGISMINAVEEGAERERVKHRILGCAYRINQATRGES